MFQQIVPKHFNGPKREWESNYIIIQEILPYLQKLTLSVQEQNGI